VTKSLAVAWNITYAVSRSHLQEQEKKDFPRLSFEIRMLHMLAKI